MFVRSIHEADAPSGSEDSSKQPPKAIYVCQIPGCAFAIKRGQLMCPKHWRELPEAVCAEVYRSWDAWLKGEENLRPYMAAQLTALIHVGKLHDIDMSEFETKLHQVRKDLLTETAEGNNI